MSRTAGGARRTAAATMLITASSAAFAGPYSSGLSNLTPGAPDPAIPGFTGPLGDGVSESPNVVNPAFVGWATSVVAYLPAPGVDAMWRDPRRALGPVSGDNFDVVSLGELNSSQIAAGTAAGQITLSFASGIRNAPGPDFAIFENSLGSDNFTFAELAHVEVSSDGVHFARFASTSLTPAAVGPYGSIDPTDVHNLAGKHVNAYSQSWGTPFDLADLASDPLVVSGLVNLNGVREVRLIDIPGDGSFPDASGRPIYDAWPTFGSGGFDLEAIGVISAWLGGDATLDGRVDARDLYVLASHWGQSGLSRGFADGDFDLNGAVNAADLAILAENWSSDSASPPSLSQLSVPEPSSVSWLGSLALLARRRAAALAAALAMALLLARGTATADVVTVDFSDKALPANSFYNGSDLAGGFTSGGAHFWNNYNTQFQSWIGFAYSNVNNTTTPGFTNQYAAITGSGVGGAGVYAVGFDVGLPPTVTLPFPTSVSGLFVTNTTYTYLAIRDGNDGFGIVRQFGDDPSQPGAGNQGHPDWYKLTIIGRDASSAITGSIEFYLADYRFADNADDYVVSDWRWVDLTGLGSSVKTLEFSVASSDVGPFGINTPTYFALDNLVYVPEPTTWAMIGVVVWCVGRGRAREDRHASQS
ncbi:DUF4465 domain-containing protein [Fontivita pretiosa]|uniref:DUF4465 domain-containing protein n=1 Tax=Fontivita pretiosa TaxID=2989684 RepID=UPI003D16A08C